MAEPGVVIAVPVWRTGLDADEEVSWRQLRRFLGGFEVRAVAPEGLELGHLGVEAERFPAACFTGTDAYSRLLLSRGFYERFAAWEYLLVYQLDALVFDADLVRWCRAGHDYLGAPWLRDRGRPDAGFSRVGNGGLSLRRVQAFLDVLDPDAGPPPWSRLLRAPLPDLERPWRPAGMLKRLRVARAARRGVAWYAGHYTLNEDHFWSDRARLFAPGFRVAPAEAALPFAFEAAPRYCFERNGRRLPFGCHAWAKWDREFWERHLTAAESGTMVWGA